MSDRVRLVGGAPSYPAWRSTVLSIVGIGFCIPQDACLFDTLSLGVKPLTLLANRLNRYGSLFFDELVHSSFDEAYSMLSCGLIMFL